MKNGKRTFGMAFGLTLALLLTTAAWARQTVTSPVTGRVTSVDSMANTFTVETSSGTYTFKTTDQTMFMQRDATTQFAELQVGDQVRVIFSGEGLNLTATHVDTTYPGTSPKGAGSTYSSTATGAAMPGATVVSGRVTSVDVPGQSITIDTTTGSQTFSLGSNVRIKARSGSSDFTDIRVGDRVRIEPMSDGSTTANVVEFVAGGPAAQQQASMRRGELPHTGSSFPLIGLMGALMVGAALLLRAQRSSNL
ncbi:MAG TPA: DUF5666 domain-containing protein [Patescibacteria group bacterium]|nr:DUF5666 domain-containing protein [Patescibacteria group bacterium]